MDAIGAVGPLCSEAFGTMGLSCYVGFLIGSECKDKQNKYITGGV